MDFKTKYLQFKNYSVFPVSFVAHLENQFKNCCDIHFSFFFLDQGSRSNMRSSRRDMIYYWHIAINKARTQENFEAILKI